MTNPNPGERLIGKARQHWAVFITPTVPFLFSVLTIFYAFRLDQGFLLLFLSAAFFLMGVLELAKVSVKFFTTDLALTNRRIVAHTGLLKRIQIEILLDQIESITVSQPLLGRVFDYGSVVIVGAGGTRQSIPSLKKPEIIRKAIYKQLQETRS